MYCRLGVTAVIIIGIITAGCSQETGRCADPAQNRWDDIGKRCRGELLLIDASPSPNTPNVKSDDRATRRLDTTIPEARIEKARQFTVAVRSQQSKAVARQCPAPLISSSADNGAGQALSQGTGVSIDKRGLILTNEHVVGKASHIEVFVSGVGWLPAYLVGSDPQTDLAVLRIDRNLPAACQFADARDLLVGQPVAAVGIPPEDRVVAESTVLTGELTALQRSLQGALAPAQDRSYVNMLESSIPIPRGYSGGPLIDQSGCVIGINAAAMSKGPAGKRLGYAIRLTPNIRSVIRRLSRGQVVEHGYLGLWVHADGDHAPKQLADKMADVVVEKVVGGGPAALAGIRSGDRITRINSITIQNASQLAELIHHSLPGESITVHVERDGQPMVMSTTLIRRM